MKSLELELQKRLLIVESDNATVVGQYEAEVNGRHIELICKGSELTEEIAIELVQEMYSQSEERMMYRDYKAKYDDEVVYTGLESFISAIESQGFYWGERLECKNQWCENGKINMPYNDFISCAECEEAELKTFNPAKTLIFEIL